MVRRYRRRGGLTLGEQAEKQNQTSTQEQSPTVEPMENEAESSSDEEEPKKEMGGRRHRRQTLRVPKGVHVKAKTLKRMLKSKGLKTTGKKSTLRARARKAHLIGGSA
jgi:hypothetical protein